MSCQQLGQPCGSGFEVEIGRIEGQVRDFGIQRRAHCGELAQHLFAIRARKQRARTVVGEAGKLLLDAGLKMHDETATAQQRAVTAIEHRTAAGGQHDGVFPEQAGQHRVLAVAEAGFTLALEKLHYGQAAFALDLVVRIQQAQPEPRGQALADAGFAGTHGADEDQVAGRIHGFDCSRGLNKSRRSVGLPRVRIPPHRYSREKTMSVAKIIELNAASKTSMEDAVKAGLKKCAESVKNIKGAWVNELKVVTDDAGNVVEWRVNLRVTFIVE